MTQSKDEIIAAAFETRLAQITVANGYRTDIGARVYRGRRKFDQQHVPCVTIVEGDDQPQDSKRREVIILQRYVFEAIVACDPDHPNDAAHAAIADLKRAIFGGDLTFDNLVRDLEYRGRTITPREDGVGVVAGGIEIDCRVHLDLANP